MERIRTLLKSKEPVKWLFYGDSITHGALHTFGRRDYTELFSERVRFEMKRPLDVVINTAISGNNTGVLIRQFDWRVRQFEPHVVFLMIGMNDCSADIAISPDEFSANLDRLCDLIGEFGGLPVLQTTCPILPGTAPERQPHFPAYMEVIRDVARNRKLPLVDHERHWEANKEKHYYWMSNAFHPNAEGHRAFARFMFESLDIFDADAASCRFFIP